MNDAQNETNVHVPNVSRRRHSDLYCPISVNHTSVSRLLLAPQPTFLSEHLLPADFTTQWAAHRLGRRLAERRVDEVLQSRFTSTLPV